MRALLLLSSLLASGVGYAQQSPQLLAPLPVDGTTRLITYTAVVPTPGIIQASLLARARVWANRVGLPERPPLVVNELGTDVLVVAGSQSLSSVYSVNPQTLYFLARVALREGRYQYRFEEYTLATPSSTGPTYETAEKLFLQEAPPRASSNSYATRQRKAFDEAAGQAAATLHTALTTPLTAGTGASTDW